MTLTDMEGFIKWGWEILNLETEILQERGNVFMKFFLMTKEGWELVLVPQPEVANDPDAKAAIAVEIKRLAKERNAEAVCMSSDTWLGVKPKGEWSDELRQSIAAMGMVRASALGLIEKREALVLSVTTRLQSVLLCQFYRREGKGERIVLEEKDRKEGQGFGRFIDMFDDLPEAHA